MNADAPLASSLALAGGDELTVYDLMGLCLDAGLVVLSVCDTARGETTGGDDVLDLTRGLLGAGAATVLMSVAVGFAAVVLIGIAAFALQGCRTKKFGVRIRQLLFGGKTQSARQ